MALVWERMQAVEIPSGSNKVTLIWVPGHHGILGDERAGKLAKEETNGVPSDQIIVITFVVNEEAIRSHLRQAPERVEKL